MIDKDRRMTDEQTKENNWHLDKRVPVATIWVLIIQLIGGIWFASQLFAQVNMLTTAAELRDGRIARVEATSAAQAVSFATLTAQLMGLRESMVEMKDAQKGTNNLLRQLGGKP